MAQKIRLGLFLVLGLLVAGVAIVSFQRLRQEAPHTEAPRPAEAGYSLDFRFEGPNPAHYSTIALDGMEMADDPARAVEQMLTQIPGEPNLVAILSSNDGKRRMEWRWLNKSWQRTDGPKN